MCSRVWEQSTAAQRDKLVVDISQIYTRQFFFLIIVLVRAFDECAMIAKEFYSCTLSQSVNSDLQGQNMDFEFRSTDKLFQPYLTALLSKQESNNHALVM